MSASPSTLSTTDSANTLAVDPSPDVLDMLRAKSQQLSSLLSKTNLKKAPLFDSPLWEGAVLRIDLSAKNQHLQALDAQNAVQLEQYIWGLMDSAGARLALGGYAESRAWYKRSENFVAEGEIRSEHLGIDYWVPAESALFCPLDGVVHSFRDNVGAGDYGPTIILRHELQGLEFFSLYGHLNRESLDGKFEGQRFSAGERLGAVGNYPVNGDWPPHLHHQLMLELFGMRGDFPGVAAKSRAEFFLTLCPDPALLVSPA